MASSESPPGLTVFQSQHSADVADLSPRVLDGRQRSQEASGQCGSDIRVFREGRESFWILMDAGG